jgi:hypothetical protein
VDIHCTVVHFADRTGSVDRAEHLARRPVDDDHLLAGATTDIDLAVDLPGDLKVAEDPAWSSP